MTPASLSRETPGNPRREQDVPVVLVKEKLV
jgi:hypothetical protein